jgi:hypothetical protein
VTDGSIENNGVVVVSDCLFYCLIDRLRHEGIVVTIAELTDDESADVLQDAAHAQIAHHPVDMVVALRDVFD